MKIEKRIILFLIGLAIIVSVIVYSVSKKAYDEAPKDGPAISTEQAPTHDDNAPAPPQN